MDEIFLAAQVAGAVVPVYNVPVINVGGNETLVVDREVLAGIFMGVITKWSDPVLLALQSESVKSKLNSSTQDIQLIVRADGSGSTEVFTKSIDRYHPPHIVLRGTISSGIVFPV